MTNNVFLIVLNLLCCSIRRFLPVAATFTSYVEIYVTTMALGVYAFILCRVWLPSRSRGCAPLVGTRALGA
jgi:hypothetical protein